MESVQSLSGVHLNRSWLTVLAATGFNLLFEYSMRGINNFLKQPFLPIFLFTAYFSLYTMINDLIARYRLRDYHLLALAFFFGTAYQFLVSGAALVQPQALGINWTSMLFVVVVWWGIVQSVLTFYFATRLAPRDWSFRLTKAGWVGALGLNVFTVLVFQRSPAIPKVKGLELAIMAAIMVVAFVAFRVLLSKSLRTDSRASRSILMDVVSSLTVAIFFMSAVFLTFDPVHLKTSNVNATASAVVTLWTIILALAIVFYRLATKRSIAV